MKTRIVRRYETWSTDPGPYSADWRYYIQEYKKVFGIFGNSKWMDSNGPYSSFKEAKDTLDDEEYQKLNAGKEEVVYEA